jgi:hypothetical protein
VKPIRKRGDTGKNKSIVESVYTDPLHVVLEASSAHEPQRRRVDYCPVRAQIRAGGGERARERARARDARERGHHTRGGREIPCSCVFLLHCLLVRAVGVVITKEITRQVYVWVCARTYARGFVNR